MINILIFPSGSLVGKEIYDALKYEKNIKCFGTDNSIDNISSYYMENYIPGCPFIKDKEATIHFLKNIIIKNNIKYIYPAFDSVIKFLKLNEEQIGCKVIAPSIKTIEICDSKLLTYNTLENYISCPIQYTKDECEFPVYVKPINGYGSRDHKIIYNQLELNEIDTTKYLLLELLPGDEFTIDCFTDKNNKLLATCPRQRIKTINGMSVESKTVELPNIKEFAQIIQNHVKMEGAWFFQVKYNKKNILTLLEIACRIPGAMCTNRMKSINYPLLTILNNENLNVNPILYNDIDIKCHKIFNNHYKCDIKYDHVYIDLDDTIIIHDKLNINAVQFLYQCINKNITLHLITRNQTPLSILDKYRLNIFDEIIQLNREHSDLKSSYITHKNSIFIDDSFIERADVSKNLGIYCFSPSELELLINNYK
jgi:hypothetical protein